MLKSCTSIQQLLSETLMNMYPVVHNMRYFTSDQMKHAPVQTVKPFGLFWRWAMATIHCPFILGCILICWSCITCPCCLWVKETLTCCNRPSPISPPTPQGHWGAARDRATTSSTTHILPSLAACYQCQQAGTESKHEVGVWWKNLIPHSSNLCLCTVGGGSHQEKQGIERYF